MVASTSTVIPNRAAGLLVVAFAATTACVQRTLALEPNAVAALPLFGHRSFSFKNWRQGTSGPANDLDIGGKAMETIGHVESLWRYPVKSMRGQEIREAFLGFAGVYGDRQYAFRDVAAPKGFPFLTGREQEAMLLYQPRFRHPDRAAEPPIWRTPTVWLPA